MFDFFRRWSGPTGLPLVFWLSLCCGIQQPSLYGAEARRVTFTLPAAAAEISLETFAEQGAAQVVYLIDDVRGVTTNPVQGAFAIREALERLVADTGLSVEQETTTGAFVIRRSRLERSSTHVPPPVLPPQAPPMKKKSTLAVIGTWLALALAPAATAAEPGGTLEGRVFNAGTRNFLRGAEIVVVGTTLNTLTDEFGRFTLANVPAGPATVKAFYRGFADGTVQVAVQAATKTTVPDIGLSDNAGVVVLDNFVVQAAVEGQAKSIIAQRDAENIITAVATDAYGNIGSNSVGNLLQFLPGVSTEGFDGEEMALAVRGMNPELGAVTTDGARLASASSTSASLGRATYVFDIGLVNYSEIEVIKAPTPERAADSAGGVVNLKTRSVFASRERSSGRLAVGLDAPLRRGLMFKRVFPSFSFNYRRILDRDARWGMALNASSNTRYVVRDQSTITYETTTVTGADGRTAFNPIVPNTPYVNTVGRQVSHQEPTRRAFGARLEFKPSDTSRFSLDVKFNYSHRYSENNIRTWRSSANTIGNPILPAGYATGTPYTGTVRIAQGYTNDEVFWPRAQARIADQTTIGDSAGLVTRFAAEHKLNGWEIDYDANFSNYEVRAFAADRIGGSETVTINDVGLRVTGFNDSHRFNLTPVGGNSPVNMTQAVQFDWNDWNQGFKEAEAYEASLNGKRRIAFAGAPTTLKLGVNVRRQNQAHLPSVYDQYRYTGSFANVTPERFGFASPFAAKAAHNDTVADWPVFGYGLLNAGATRADVLVNNPGDWRLLGVHANGRFNRGFEEDISSAYVQATTRLFRNRFIVLAGVRFERTDVAAWDLMRPDPIAGTPVTRGESSYANSFPSLHGTWKFTPEIQFRASFSSSIARPPPGSIIPGITITDDLNDSNGIGGRVDQVNVGLKPRFIDNYEVELEYYPRGGGRASIGFFRKEMSSFIFGYTDIIGAGPANGFDGAYEGWELRTQRNGGEGRIQGFEVDLQSPNLGKFVSFLQGFSLTANLTKLRATGNYGDGGSGVLAGFQPETANVGVNYRFARTSIRVRGNFRGEYLRFPSTNPASQRYEYDTLKWDLSLEQKLRGNMSAYLDVLNITNTYGRRFYGSPEMGRRLAWVDNNGPQLNAGVNIVF